AANADAFLVAPASANTVAKLAAGLCDSLLATSFLACQAPRAVAPAMNDRMYRDAATQANLTTLRERGVRVIDPDEGALASRGDGRRCEAGARRRRRSRASAHRDRGSGRRRRPRPPRRADDRRLRGRARRRGDRAGGREAPPEGPRRRRLQRRLPPRDRFRLR